MPADGPTASTSRERSSPYPRYTLSESPSLSRSSSSSSSLIAEEDLEVGSDDYIEDGDDDDYSKKTKKKKNGTGRGGKRANVRKHLSCEGCRVRKMKCSRTMPCASCKMRGEPCVWAGAQPQAVADEDELEASQSEIARLRKLVDLLLARLDEQDASASKDSRGSHGGGGAHVFEPTLARLDPQDLYPPSSSSSVLPVPYSSYAKQPMHAHSTDPRSAHSPHSLAFEAGMTAGFEFPTFTISHPGV